MLGAGELEREYGLSMHQLQYLRDRGRLPKPWLSFSNRNVYERGAMENFFSTQAREKVQSTVQRVRDLPARERAEALKMLRELDELD